MLGLVNFAAEPHSVELRDLPEPQINDDEVLLEVGAVGICGSDLHQYTGQHSWKVNYPVVLGHEFGGIIARTGGRVRKFRAGDRVVSETAAVLDLDSPFTRAGQYNLDPNRLGFGYGVHGAMTRFVRVPERCLHRVPDSLPLERAALTEPCCVAYNAVCMNAHIRPGDSVAVIGPGPIGLLCAVMAKLSGASPLIVIGVKADAKRLAVARTIGATHAFGEHGEDVKTAVAEIGDGYGVDVVVDAAGVSATLQLALALVRPGGQISKVGWGREPVGFSLDPLVAKAVTLRGSFSHNWPMWEKVLGMLASGQINLDPILNRVAPLEEWKDCFDAMHRGDLVKAVLKP
jgi:alcohol dehydrogenase/L-iditol 2-dehydrogenase